MMTKFNCGPVHELVEPVEVVESVGVFAFEASSKTSEMLRMGSPLITLRTSSAFKVSCSTRACASWRLDGQLPDLD